jgi:hypothetical protein
MNIPYFLLERVQAATTPPPLAPDTTHGDASDSQGVGGNIDNLKDTLGMTFDKVITTLTIIAGVAAVIFLIYYGILYITSQGNPEKTKLARAGIINAIVGIIIITAAYGIIRLAITIGNTANTVV